MLFNKTVEDVPVVESFKTDEGLVSRCRSVHSFGCSHLVIFVFFCSLSFWQVMGEFGRVVWPVNIYCHSLVYPKTKINPTPLDLVDRDDYFPLTSPGVHQAIQ
jgi:hypothetical protein